MRAGEGVDRSPSGSTDGDIRDTAVFQGNWYHSIELLPGLYTAGKGHRNIALIRDLLRRCEIEGMNCLDVGAADCLSSILMRRRGALNVMAQDIHDRGTKIRFLQDTLHIEFTYVGGTNLSDLKRLSEELGLSSFDVIVFSGVLYHMPDPLTGLLTVRQLVRDGGLILVETAAVADERMVAYFNAHGRLYSGTGTYWLPSVELLEYWLRFAKLMPIDCLYLGRNRPSLAARLRRGSKPPLCRIAVACRAMGEFLPFDDPWLKDEDSPQRVRHFGELRKDDRSGSAGPEVRYVPRSGNLVFRNRTNAVNLYQTVRANKSFGIRSIDEQVRLQLGAAY
jgi:SAM-dependent methyltransferase